MIRPALMLVALLGLADSARAQSAVAYAAIDPKQANQTITLTGHALSVEQIIAVARFGAKVTLTQEARDRSAAAYGLLLEAATEGVPVYWFNRGDGDQREVTIFSGDPLSAENRPVLAARQLAQFKLGGQQGFGAEVSDEEIVRAAMVIRANTMSYEAASPPLTQMLLDLLNKRVTPAVPARGTVGEGDLAVMGAIGAVMVGEGSAYLNGVRMPAAKALKEAGLTPLQPFGADDAALTSTNAYAAAQAALLVADARDALDWADVIYAMDLEGMNSSLTPLSLPVQSNRPFHWLNWDARRVLNLLRGSYLFALDPRRIIQDPESLRASSQRQGSAWQAWRQLESDLLITVNCSDHNPAVRPGMGPADSWELATPEMMRFYVKGGPESHGQHGFIFSNANWDPYPLANDIEDFTLALANMDVAVELRMHRFDNTLFTVVKPEDILPPADNSEEQFRFAYLSIDLWQEIQGLAMPVPPEGQAVVATVEDLQAQTRLKALRGRQAVEASFQLLALDLLNGAFWMDLRHVQDPGRAFGSGTGAALAALRRQIPRGGTPTGAVSFLKSYPARLFFPPDVTEPDPPDLPLVH
jgi:histidine ammonia-lyase